MTHRMESLQAKEPVVNSDAYNPRRLSTLGQIVSLGEYMYLPFGSLFWFTTGRSEGWGCQANHPWENIQHWCIFLRVKTDLMAYNKWVWIHSFCWVSKWWARPKYLPLKTTQRLELLQNALLLHCTTALKLLPFAFLSMVEGASYHI